MSPSSEASLPPEPTSRWVESRILRRRLGIFVFLQFLLSSGAPAFGQTADRVTQAAGRALARIAHSAPAWTAFATDAGRVEANHAMPRMLLALSPAAEKQQALRQFLDDLQNRQSPQYHHWLTPDEFGKRFGVTPEQSESVRQWLAASGFQVEPASRSRLWVEFSGTAQQVESAFHSELHYYEWHGKRYLANATDIAVPAQFAEITRGAVSLDNFGKRPTRPTAGPGQLQPNLTASGQTNVYYVAPGDFAAIYNTKGLLSSGIDGAGIAIAVTAQSQIELSDMQAFRQIFVSGQANDPNYILSGPDPGIAGPIDLQEAQLDVEWAGAVAPGATIDLVIAGSTDTTSGVDLAAIYAIDNRIAPILTYTYGACETLLSPTQNAFYNSLWQQAAAEGITVLAATGDNGEAGCDAPLAGTPAFHGPAVNGAAATPYNVAVGGTQFTEGANLSAYWGANNENFASALGYIPEAAWNESCDPGQATTATNCVFGNGNFSLLAGSGGASSLYAKPAWQTGPGVPADGARDLPDVALAAAASHDDVVYCNSVTGTACEINEQGEVVGLTLVGGTSVSTPAMAGILALVEQKNGAYQGQINYTLYKLAQANSCNSSNQTNPTAQTACVFYDVTAGNNAVPCEGGSPGCSSQQNGVNGVLLGGAAGVGYDLATGLGSVNAMNLANLWNSTFLTGTETALQAPTSFAHGTSVTVSGSVTSMGSAGSPTGMISLTTGTTGAAPDVLTVTNGIFSATVKDLPGGSYNLSAHYSGDATYAASDSAGVAVNVLPETSNTTLTVNGLEAGSAAYGAAMRVDVAIAGASGFGAAMGSMTLLDNGNPVGAYQLTADGKVSIPSGGGSSFSFAPGNHSLIAEYSGDASFLTSTSAATTFSVGKSSPFVVVGANSSSLPTGQSLGVHAVVSGSGASLATGMVQFTVDGAAQGAPVALQAGGLFGTQAQASAILTSLSTGTHVIGAIYDGSSDPNYSSVPAGDGTNESTFTVNVGNNTGSGGTTTALSITTLPAALGDSGTFRVSVTPATATGSVSLWDAVGPRSSSVNVSGGSATIQLEWTQGGSFSVYAVYSGDASNASSSSAKQSFTVQRGVPQVSLSVLGPSGTLSQTTLLASVTGNLKNGTLASPTGIVEFWDSVNGGAAQLLGTWQLTPGAAGAAVAGARLRLAEGTHAIYTHYRGDTNWQAGDSANESAPSFTVSASPNPLTFKGGTSGSATVTVTPAGGFTGTVNLSCPADGALPLAGYTCSISPAQVNVTGAGPQAATLQLTPTVAVMGAVERPEPGATFWAGTGLWSLVLAAGALALWATADAGARANRSRTPGWARACTALAASILIGCGGGGGGSGGGGGPFPTKTSLSVQQSGTALRVTVSVSSSGATPSGSVVLVVDGGTSTSAGVSAGLATFLFTPSPAVGIHTLEARYQGDSKNQGSDSGAQTTVLTGSASFVIVGTSGTISAPSNVPVTLN